MSGYRYTFFDIDGRTCAEFTSHNSSDEDACGVANELLSRSQFTSLKLRKGPRQLYHISRMDFAKTS